MGAEILSGIVGAIVGAVLSWLGSRYDFRRRVEAEIELRMEKLAHAAEEHKAGHPVGSRDPLADVRVLDSRRLKPIPDKDPKQT